MDKRIESHNSFLTNRRVNYWLCFIDTLGYQAANTLQFNSINSYYNALEQIYINGLATVLKEEEIDKIEGIREKYNRIVSFIDADERARTKKSLRLLLQLSKKFNYHVSLGLQKLGYFFRVGTAPRKGLKNINFYEGSIFGVDKDESKGQNEKSSSQDGA